jgi:ElaB/YqjD/DUF883 family membrane-anchored ribosome-binding protein
MNTTELNTENLTTDVKRVARDSEELLKATAATAGDKTHDLRQRLSRAVETAKETCQRLEQKAVQGAKATDKVIREHPYQSIGIVFAIGVLIGVLVSRR